MNESHHGIGGQESPAKEPPAGGPGAITAFVVFSPVSGAGTESETVEFSVTDTPADGIVKVCLLVEVAHVCGGLVPPSLKVPIAPSTRRRTDAG